MSTDTGIETSIAQKSKEAAVVDMQPAAAIVDFLRLKES